MTVVLPVRNEAPTILACMSSLLRQEAACDLRIIVVDGDSQDATREIVEGLAARHPQISLLSNPRSITAAGLNIGIRAAAKGTIARMDGHTVAPPDYLARGLADLAETGAWAVGGQMRRIGTTPTTEAIAAATMSPFGVGDAAHNFSTERMWAETVFLGMWPTWVFEQVGLFDEELVRNQDDELSYRIREAGGRILFDPLIRMAYQPRATYRALFDQYRQYGVWKIRVLQMHPRSLRPRHCVPMLWVGWLVVAALGSTLHPAGGFLLVVGAGSYLLVMIAAAIRMRRGIAGAGRVVAAFLALHLGYGIGFWQGLIRFAPRWFIRREGAPPRLEPSADGLPEVSTT